MKSRSSKAAALFPVRKLAIWSAALWAIAGVEATSNIDPDRALAWGANIGWVNWRAHSAAAAQIGEFVCSGFIYGQNVGWIHLGAGQPASGIYYRNDSADDFGVNHDPFGRLWGLAYGANIGWISFATNGAPRADLKTGKLSGFAYGANVGWINLGDSNFSIHVDAIPSGTDSDNDGIPDAWELIRVSNLGTLARQGDADRDGHSDLEEYLADSDPTDPQDQLRILAFFWNPSAQSANIAWTTRPTRRYSIQVRSGFEAAGGWTDSGLGIQIAEGNSLSSTVTNLANPKQSYFRIQAVRPLAP